MLVCYTVFWFFFFNDTATTEIYTLSLHDALPISRWSSPVPAFRSRRAAALAGRYRERDRKSTRLNSSHGYISYAVFCLKKKMLRSKTWRHDLCPTGGEARGCRWGARVSRVVAVAD